MTKRADLPPELFDTPFLARDATVPRNRLFAQDLNRQVHGTRTTTLELSLVDRCTLFQLRMPADSYFSHDTAALLQGIPMPYRLSNPRDVHIVFPAPARAPHARGLRGHSMAIEPFDVVTLANGLRVTTPLRTWLDLGTRMSVEDLVAAGDYLIHWRHPIVSRGVVGEAVLNRRGIRGLRRLKQAAPLLSTRSESPPESVLRVVLVRAGLGEPKVNYVMTTLDGEFVARIDLYIESLGVILEYMGDYHRTVKDEWRRDMTRRSKLETTTGLRVMELNADDLHDRDELIARILTFAALRTR